MKKIIKEFAPYIIAIILVLVIKFFVVSPIRVNGPSMKPTLHDKDIMILNKISYHFDSIKRFDIVVIDYKNEYLIKRVVGLPGEYIEYINNELYVNGKKVKEDFDHEETGDFDIYHAIGKSKIPANKYLVLGDNRLNSMDSRAIGFIDRDSIQGKTSFTVLPFSRFGNKK